MNLTDFTTAIIVDETPEHVFQAITNVRGWWSEEITGDTDKLNQEFNYHFQDVHRCRIKITELIPGEKVVWLVMDNFFKFTADKSEWIGNRMIFDISEKNGKTQLRFTQEGLVPEYECYQICANAWNQYIGESLRNLILTGQGRPNAKDRPTTSDEAEFVSNN